MKKMLPVDWKISDGVELDGLDYLGDCKDAMLTDCLCGPFREAEHVRIDIGARSSIDELIEKMALRFGGETLKPSDGSLYLAVTGHARAFIAQHLSPNPSLMETTGQDELRIVEIFLHEELKPIGLALLQKTVNDDEIIKGLIFDGEINVNITDRAMGYGRGLIAAQLLSTGTLPPWDQEYPTYTHAGAAVTRKGMELALKLAGPRLEPMEMEP
jgi:hypothetical protein